MRLTLPVKITSILKVGQLRHANASAAAIGRCQDSCQVKFMDQRPSPKEWSAVTKSRFGDFEVAYSEVNAASSALAPKEH